MSSTEVANPKAFVNSDATAVQDGIEGIVLASPNLNRLDGYPDVKVVFRTDWDKSKVAIVSGGGSGHEPMHGGFVGCGMLTAAVSGEVFASPSVDAVLAGICAVTGPQGCLLVIKNYTGDRLNFTLAAQKARDLFQMKVETVIVNDDVATGAKRGIAGTLLVHKAAGAAAEAGASLEEVKKAAQLAIDSTASLGVSFSTCGRRYPERMSKDEMEVGLGIHGESGASKEPLKPCGEIVTLLVDKLLTSDASKSKLADASGYVALVNNLGAVPPVEMGVVVKALMASGIGPKIKALIGPAPLCTSLDMNGFSISLMALSGSLEEQILASCKAPAWPAAVTPNRTAPASMPFKSQDVSYLENAKPSSNPAVEAMLTEVCNILIASRQELDKIDAVVGDADCGSTMATGAERILQHKDKLPFADKEVLCRCLSDLLGLAMGGSSGVLLRVMFLGMADALKADPEISVGAAFAKGLDAMMAAGGAGEGYRTMLDALCPAAKVLSSGGSLADAKAAAAAGADATKTMQARAGRSENVPEDVLLNTPDPGAVAAAKVFEALDKAYTA